MVTKLKTWKNNEGSDVKNYHMDRCKTIHFRQMCLAMFGTLMSSVLHSTIYGVQLLTPPPLPPQN